MSTVNFNGYHIRNKKRDLSSYFTKLSMISDMKFSDAGIFFVVIGAC